MAKRPAGSYEQKPLDTTDTLRQELEEEKQKVASLRRQNAEIAQALAEARQEKRKLLADMARLQLASIATWRTCARYRQWLPASLVEEIQEMNRLASTSGDLSDGSPTGPGPSRPGTPGPSKQRKRIPEPTASESSPKRRRHQDREESSSSLSEPERSPPVFSIPLSPIVQVVTPGTYGRRDSQSPPPQPELPPLRRMATAPSLSPIQPGSTPPPPPPPSSSESSGKSYEMPRRTSHITPRVRNVRLQTERRKRGPKKKDPSLKPLRLPEGPEREREWTRASGDKTKLRKLNEINYDDEEYFQFFIGDVLRN